MSAEAATVRAWRVGPWTVTLTMPPIVAGQAQHAVAEWTPSMPDRPFTATEKRQYEAGLFEAVAAAQLALDDTHENPPGTPSNASDA